MGMNVIKFNAGEGQSEQDFRCRSPVDPRRAGPKLGRKKGQVSPKTQEYNNDFNHVSSEKNILTQAGTVVLFTENHTLGLVDGSTTFFPRFFSRSQPAYTWLTGSFLIEAQATFQETRYF
jgi:hypothetical protein